MNRTSFFTRILIGIVLLSARTVLSTDAIDYFSHGVNAFKAQKYDEAIDHFTNAIAHDPHCAAAYYNLGLTYNKKGETEKELWCYEHANVQDPNDTQISLLLGKTYQKQKKYEAALATYQAILNANPNNMSTLKALASLYEEQGKKENLLSILEEIVSITPDDTQVRFDYANNLLQGEKVDLAIENYKALLKLRPNNPNVCVNLGHALRSKGAMNQAIEYYQKALAYLLNNPYIHYGLAEAYLATGNFIDGFREFEWRYKRETNTRKLGEKPWDGSNPAGKKLLIRCEYGQGDTIQFIRYAKLLKDRGAYIIVEAQDTLIPLLHLLPYIDELVIVKDPVETLPPHDYQIPLMSLPRLFSTSLETVPATVPYIYPSTPLVEYWKKQIAQDKNIKIGICWKTSPYYESFKTTGAKKSVPLSTFIPIARIPGVSMYSLQKMDGLEELNELPAGIIIHSFADFDDSHGRFMDTAALITNLDLVISVDTSVAHIAGALGKKVFTLLPSRADWRWMLDRSDSPWYPTMLLFRRTASENWNSVINTITPHIEKMVKERNSTASKPTAVSVTAEIPVGELIDKITILEIKKREIKDAAKLHNIDTELASLRATEHAHITPSSTLDSLTDELLTINKKLWNIEDAIREKERQKTFDQGFIDLARSVYFSNDDRCKIKRAINELLGSRLLEEKSYTEYRKA